jgi:hypothetical protein
MCHQYLGSVYREERMGKGREGRSRRRGRGREKKKEKLLLKKKKRTLKGWEAGCWQHTPVILTTWEADMPVQVQKSSNCRGRGKKKIKKNMCTCTCVLKNRTTGEPWWLTPVILPTGRQRS